MLFDDLSVQDPNLYFDEGFRDSDWNHKKQEKNSKGNKFLGWK